MKTLLLLSLALASMTVDLQWSSHQTLPTIALSEAHAWNGEDRRVARRTARRTSRRVAYRQYYNTLPGGCVWYAPYYSCGGIYYEPVIENGTTVYVIVEDNIK